LHYNQLQAMGRKVSSEAADYYYLKDYIGPSILEESTADRRTDKDMNGQVDTPVCGCPQP
jgi:hypothetical protein